MIERVLPFLFVLALWWIGTGVVLYLDGLPQRTFRWSRIGASVLALASLALLVVTRDSATPAGAYAAFGAALVLWGWHEIAFLTGFLTGPRKRACPEPCRGWRHAIHAAQTILYHEIAIVITVAGVAALTWDRVNPVGAWSLLILWGMRLSTKLNVFLGVPNLSVEFLPEHLFYLSRFFTHKPMNPWFPVSITASTALAVLLLQRVALAEIGSYPWAASSLLTALVVFGVLEHWFLVLPVPLARLWSWGFRSRRVESGRADAEAATIPNPPAR